MKMKLSHGKYKVLAKAAAMAVIGASLISCGDSGVLKRLSGKKGGGGNGGEQQGGTDGLNSVASVGENGFAFSGPANLAPRVRLKSTSQIYQSIKETFGVEVNDAKSLPPEPMDTASGFLNNSNAYVVGQNFFLDMSKLATKVSQNIPDSTLMKYCVNPNATGTNCANAFLSNYGKSLLGRDVTPEEKTSVMKVHSATYKPGADKEAVRAMAEMMIQMPSFLYRTEALSSNTKGANVRMTGVEIAGALASFFWDAPPDAALNQAAASGKLSDAVEVEKQARRLAADPKARTGFARFALQWLDIRDIESKERLVTTFPGFSQTVVASMLEETRTYVVSTVFDGDSSLKTLMNGKTTYLDKTLSSFYGFGQVPDNTFTEVPLPKFKAGVLTHGSFQMAHAGDSQTSPVRRGSFVRTRLMCNVIGKAPADAPTEVPPIKGGQTVQDLYAQHKLPGCMNCHKLINPIGFGFENIDAVGRTRTLSNKLKIDSSGDLTVQSSGKSRPFATDGGLYESLAALPDVADCFTLRMFQFAMGRNAGNQDKALLDNLATKFKSDNWHVLNLMIDIAIRPEFVTRNTL